jgi:hypothetical protein
MHPISKIIISGTLASAGAALVLSGRAKQEGRWPSQPMNATSHWLQGDEAARHKQIDIRHTALGAATHWMASLLWAGMFHKIRHHAEHDNVPAIARDALVTTITAVTVDYVFTPHRLTPGWELVLSKRGMAYGYLGMAAGLMIGEIAFPTKDSNSIE